MIQLAITGCRGRMGRRITELAAENPAFKIRTLMERPDHPDINQEFSGTVITADPEAIAGNDCLIDFTWPEATLENLEMCLKHNVRHVIGTTGFSQEQRNQIREAAKSIPIVFSSNMSVGVNLLFKLAEICGSVTRNNYPFHIEETHHVHKKDSPSGTAKTLAEVAEQATGRKISQIDAFREGEVIGNHTITFESAEDVITITHQAKTRDIFVKGALEAAQFLIAKPAGLYSMQDVLNLT